MLVKTGNVRRAVGAFLALVGVLFPLAPTIAEAQDRLPEVQVSTSAGAIGYSVAISAIDQSDSSLTTARFRSLVDSGSLGELASVRARRISIPSLSVTVTAPQEIAAHFKSTALSLSDIVFDDVQDGRAATMTVGSISWETPWGASKLDNFTARNVDASALIAFFGKKTDAASADAPAGITFEDIAFNAPHPGNPDRDVRLEILSLAVALAKHHNGIPTSFDVEGIGFKFDLPDDLEHPALAILRAVGRTHLEGTFRVAAEWNEGQDTVSIREMSLTGKDLGGVFLIGEITNAGKALFSDDHSEARAAFSALAGKFVTLSVIDSGLGDLLAGEIVKSTEGDIRQKRVALAELAENRLNEVLNSSQEPGAVDDAVKRFIAGEARNLDITIQAKTDPGIDLTELSDVRTTYPALLQRVRIDAEAK
ncbi:hypothetical protein LJR030_001132 [Rhizobium sp. LjRoot30]